MTVFDSARALGFTLPSRAAVVRRLGLGLGLSALVFVAGSWLTYEIASRITAAPAIEVMRND